ncbi:hypothetical protein ACJJTC_017910 [Scirpophaga incertulas]
MGPSDPAIEKGLISETEIYESTDMQIEICGPPPIKRRWAPWGVFVQLSGALCVIISGSLDRQTGADISRLVSSLSREVTVHVGIRVNPKVALVTRLRPRPEGRTPHSLGLQMRGSLRCFAVAYMTPF